MPIQIPEQSWFPLVPPSTDLLTATDTRFFSHKHHASQDIYKHISGYDRLDQRRSIVAETSHLTELAESLGNHPKPDESPSSGEASPSPPTSLSFSSQQQSLFVHHPPQPRSTIAQGPVMAKKRRSLQAILVPPFFQAAMSADNVLTLPSPSSSMRTRSHSAAASTSSYALPPAIPIPSVPSTRPHAVPQQNSPPSDLLDDDPFANLAPAPSTVLLAEPSTSSIPSSSPLRPTLDTAPLPHKQPTPRSPLANSFTDVSDESDSSWRVPPRTPPPTPINGRQAGSYGRRPRSSGNGQARPAYTRPAFASRPSLPSLNTLSQMHVIVPKVKRGRVGAKLPAEPWELVHSSPVHSDDDDDLEEEGTSVPRGTSGLSTIRDSRLYSPERDESGPGDASEELPDGADIERSTTPRASEQNNANRPNVLIRAQSDPTPSRPNIASPLDEDADIYAYGVSDDASYGSPDVAFPAAVIVQSPMDIPEQASPAEYGYSSVRGFSRQARSSLYEDLASTLGYDYSQAVSQFHRPPSSLYAFGGAAAPESHAAEEGECDFEPGTSARTIRSHLHSAPHERTSSSQSVSMEWTTEMDVNPLSPISASSFTSGETSSSSGTSSDYGDEVDFLSFDSDSDEGDSSEYQSALGTLPETSTRSRSRSPPRFVAHGFEVEQKDESESVGA
ncbi:hypothetical protein BDW22DRAFT_652425 [Trametopsis cervina]|nr:hypothetical protein BDW22DRAFT_652425 [Trametopsis cervina]